MRTHADETFKAAVRRSLPIVIGLVLLGFLAVNGIEQLKGPQYQAVAQVEVSATPLSSIITNSQPSFVDPQQFLDTAAALAASPQVYEQTRQQTHGALGSADSLQSETNVGEVTDTDILTFTASSSGATKAVRIANAVAEGYITYRGQLHSSSIDQTIAKLAATLAATPSGPQHAQVAANLRRAQLIQGASGNDATLVERSVSAGKTSPSPVKDSLIGLSLGLIVALLIVALREAVDSTVRSEADVEDVLSKPVLASVRPLPRRTKLVTYGRHESAFSDTYSLLAAKLVPPKDAKRATVLAVTSALSREGKTSTAANLAVIAARRGANVILADMDFRKSELSSLFNVPGSAMGALQVLDGSASLEEVLWSVELHGLSATVHRNGGDPAFDKPHNERNGHGGDAQGTLRLLSTGGELTPRQANERPVLAPLLRALRADSQMVIIDTPPALLTAEMTELATLIDLAIVVVRQGYVSQRSLRALARYAQSWPTDVAGAVLTDVRMPSQYGMYYGAK